MSGWLGLFDSWEFRSVFFFFNDTATTEIYTDGITEAFNANDEEFGEGRLVEALQTHRTLAPGDLVAAIYDEVRRFSPEEQRDDMTVIVARCKNC